MKKLKILWMFIFCIFIGIVDAASNPYPRYYKDNTNCTWYAWEMAYQKSGVVLPSWGDANRWYENAKRDGYSVGTVPQANSIAIWTNCTEDCALYGHVGYVESVSSDGKTLYIKDSSYWGMNGCPDSDDPTYKECIRNGVSEETDKICLENAPKITCAFAVDVNSFGIYTGDITQYIYLNDAPKEPVNNVSQTIIDDSKPIPPKEVEQPLEEVKKSNNTNLIDIKLSNAEIEFSNNIATYQVFVENEIESIEITVNAEDEKATVSGSGEHLLEIGENLIEIVVAAEDGTQKVYNLNITRKEKEVLEETENLEETIESPVITNQNNNKNNNNTNNIILIIIGVVVAIIITTITIFVFIKRKKITSR